MTEANQTNAQIDVDTYDGFPGFDKNYVKKEFILPVEEYNNKEKREEYFKRAKDYALIAQVNGYTEIRIILRRADKKWKAKDRFFTVKELLDAKN